MATLLHFLRSLTVTLLAGFVLSLGGLSLLMFSLMALKVSPVAAIAQPFYHQLNVFLTVFGGGDRFGGMVAIALTLGFVASLLGGFGSYKRSQRSEWHLAGSQLLEK